MVCNKRGSGVCQTQNRLKIDIPFEKVEIWWPKRCPRGVCNKGRSDACQTQARLKIAIPFERVDIWWPERCPRKGVQHGMVCGMSDTNSTDNCHSAREVFKSCGPICVPEWVCNKGRSGICQTQTRLKHVIPFERVEIGWPEKCPRRVCNTGGSVVCQTQTRLTIAIPLAREVSQRGCATHECLKYVRHKLNWKV